jgi:hypothetical protein
MILISQGFGYAIFSIIFILTNKPSDYDHPNLTIVIVGLIGALIAGQISLWNK